jgi:cytochrome c-type biogenesis protein CcmH/NrfG
MENGDLQAASTWGQRAVELSPDDEDARLTLAEIFTAMNMKARAKAELNAILKKNPEHPEAKSLLKGL